MIHEDANYTSGEVSALAYVSLRQLQWWDEKEVVIPRQSGHRRLYSPRDVIEIQIISALRSRGISLQGICRILRKIRVGLTEKLSKSPLFLITDGRKMVYLETDSARILDILKHADRASYVVCISDFLDWKASA